MIKVLIAEDEESFRAILPQLLGGAGFDVEVAESGQVAIDKARRFKPDVLVADWMLEGITGIDVAETLLAELPGLQVIFITGFGCDELRVQAQQRGISFFDCLEKPFGVNALIDGVRAALDDPA